MKMTLLHIKLLMHYHCDARDYKACVDSAHANSIAVSKFTNELCEAGLLVPTPRTDLVHGKLAAQYRATDKGSQYLGRLKRLPIGEEPPALNPAESVSVMLRNQVSIMSALNVVLLALEGRLPLQQIEHSAHGGGEYLSHRIHETTKHFGYGPDKMAAWHESEKALAR